ncbi:MAG: glycosyltransferase family 2 protein, partial [Prevotellaceae bacterium]|nr:glycosyltransferase family 2 protein [Prevotellaceae bacterium]
MPKFSIIIPVYNRPDEIEELLQSLENQTIKNFEAIIIEDGSDLPCKEIAEKFSEKFPVIYHSKHNSGRSDTRNAGMRLATGSYFVFFDSDCIIPPDYFDKLTKNLSEDYSDCYGGPDAAHESF